MKVRIKIDQLAPLGFGIIIILIFITNLINQSSFKSVLESMKIINETSMIKNELLKLQKLLVDVETGQRGFLYTEDEKFLEVYNSALPEIPKSLSDTQKILQSRILNQEYMQRNVIQKQLDYLEEVEKLSEERLNIISTTIDWARTGKTKDALSKVKEGKGKLIMDQIRDTIKMMLDLEEEILNSEMNDVEQAQTLSFYISWVGTLFMILVSILISLIISRIIHRSLAQVIQVAQQVADGDLTHPIESISDDEIGKLFSAFQTMTMNLSSLISQVRNAGIQVTSSSTQISASSKQLEATINEQVASTNQITATTVEIAATATDLAKTIEQVSEMAENTTGTADQGQQNLNRMETTIRQLADATTSISGKLGVISEKANNINTVVITITKVADQTNLLSLNAAIEAEKAGEYGSGFSVVAREIRRLADQTAVATLEIETMVKEMQSAVATGVMEMDKFTQEVHRGVDDIEVLSQQLSQIILQIQQLTPHFLAVNQGMEAQSQGAQQIRGAMQQLSEASIQTAQVVQDTSGAIEQLNDVTQGLQRAISRFKIMG